MEDELFYIDDKRIYNYKLIENDDYEPNKVYPSRRSWERLDHCLTQGGLLNEASPTLYHLTCAFVGMEAAVSFNDFIANYDRQVTPDDVFSGNIEKTKDFTINDHTALVEKFDSQKCFVDEVSADKMENFAKYFITLPAEVAMKMWTVMGAGDMKNTVNLHSVKLENQSVSSFLVEILTGKSLEDQ